MIIGRNYYDDYDYYGENLYSEAFLEGYDYAQREFKEESKEDRKRRILKTIGIGAGGTGAAIAGGAFGPRLLDKGLDRIEERQKNKIRDYYKDSIDYYNELKDIAMHESHGATDATRNDIAEFFKNRKNSFNKKIENKLKNPKLSDKQGEYYQKALRNSSEIFANAEQRATDRAISDLWERRMNRNLDYNKEIDRIKGYISDDLDKVSKSIGLSRKRGKKAMAIGSLALGGSALAGAALYNHRKKNTKD